MAKKTYVLDTSVYLTDWQSIFSYGYNDIIIPLKVLEEIDKHKKRQDTVGNHARNFIKFLDGLRASGDLTKGVRIRKGCGLVRCAPANSEVLPADYPFENPDNKIISVALAEQKETPERKVIIASRDINMRVKCDSFGIPAEDYTVGKLVKASTDLYRGFVDILVDDQMIEQFYANGEICLEEEKLKDFYPNQFVMLVSNVNEKRTALAKYPGYNRPLRRVVKYKEGVWGIRPRNKEQSFAFDLLMDRNVPIVTLVGQAGSGKTLCALAAGLEQVINGHDETGYKRVVVAKPVQPMGRDIGFLPGTVEEKMAPWLAPIQDNLRFLMNSDKVTLQMYLETGTIEIEALTYIRGRSIANTYIIIDEAQNLTQHELKTIITRVGENSKIILTGDIEQIDTIYLDELTNGLSYALEKFKDHDLAGHITLLRGERSKVATLAAKIL